MTESPNTVSVLLVEDNQDDAALLKRMMARDPMFSGITYKFNHVRSLAEMFEFTEDHGEIDAVLLDLGLPDSRGTDTVRTVLNHLPDAAIIVLTGLDDDRVGVEAIGIGAQDFLVKDHIDSRIMQRALHYAIQRKQLDRELQQHAETLRITQFSLDKAAISVLWIDDKEKIIYANESASRLLDYSHFELLKQDFQAVAVSGSGWIRPLRPAGSRGMRGCVLGRARRSLRKYRAIRLSTKVTISFVSSFRTRPQR